ncbi:hypothetical protein COY95_02545, partial [Candidatus Woesearchaeota archaeon CG_4_10_14_0_8_um_filter_47_5]
MLRKYPGACFVAVVVQGVENNEEHKTLHKELQKEKRQLEAQLRKSRPDPLSIPLIREENQFFREFGKKNPLIYQLNSVISGKPIPADTPLKDILFMIELRHGCIVSAQDLATLSDELVFDLSEGGEPFTPLHKILHKKTGELKPDDIILRKGNQAGNSAGDLVLISHLYGPGHSTCITPKTQDCLFLLWHAYEPEKQELDATLLDFRHYLKLISSEKTTITVFEVGQQGKAGQQSNVGQAIQERQAIQQATQEGQAASAHFTVTPWEVKGNIDYDKLIREFGTKKLDKKLLSELESVAGASHQFLRRKIFYSHMYFDDILSSYKKGEKFYLYTGRAPSGPVHLGHLVPWLFTKWLQDVFKVPLLFQIPDEEKFLAKQDMTLEETKKWAYDNILDIIALGFDPKLTKIFLDTEYAGHMYSLACQVAKKITFSTIKSTFGFTNEKNIGIIFYTAMQSVPCLLPTVMEGRPTRVLIPCAIDQDV